ncbi:MAG: hypothetical protein RSC68_22020 [Acinetobacter sp.]
MNTTDFIKQHGIDKARKVIDGAPKWAMSINFNNGMYYSRMEHKKGDTFLYDIKRLIESVGLVNKLGGIAVAKEKLAYGNSISAMRLSYETTITDRDGTKQNVITGVYLEDLEQAIADYESIYSNDMGDDTHIENHVSPLCKVGVK